MSQKVPSLHWWVLILAGMGLNGLLAYYPAKGPLLFNPFSFFLDDDTSRTVIKYIFRAAVLIHVAEGAYAYNLAQKVDKANALFWGIQTTILGFPSLRLLKAKSRAKAN